VVEVYDEYYAQNEQYAFLKSTLESLLKDDVHQVQMITSYVSEDKAVEPLSTGCPYSFEKLAALSDDDFMRLSQPVTYDIKFETETYRSGRKHIKKIRYKDNPYGKIVGKHDGAQFYTIGQRKGLNIGGHKDSVFVIDTDIRENIIYVGEGHTHKGLSRCCLRIDPSEIHWIRPDLRMAEGEIRRYRVRIRYRQPLQDATMIMRQNGLYILFDAPQRGITPGQFAAWYDGDEMLGSGVI
jgi:tRNA-specific 2-thiouridylase